MLQLALGCIMAGEAARGFESTEAAAEVAEVSGTRRH